MTYFVPGFFLRQVLGNMTALKSWVFAAIRLVKPKFPVSAELEPLVAQVSRELSQTPLLAQKREQLTDVVSKLSTRTPVGKLGQNDLCPAIGSSDRIKCRRKQTDILFRSCP